MKKIRTTITLLTLIAGLILTGCQKDCTESDRCNLEPDTGPCEAYFPRYYYDKEDKKCKEFIWGGCNGTVPFETIEACEQKCECE